MAALKRSPKLLIYDPRGYLYCVYRAPGDWSNPNTISLIGTDGDTVDGVQRQVREKLDLATAADDWSVAGTVDNPANNEINAIWTFGRPLDHLYVPARRLWRASMPQTLRPAVVRYHALACAVVCHAGDTADLRRACGPAFIAWQLKRQHSCAWKTWCL